MSTYKAFLMKKNDKSPIYFQLPKILHDDKNIKSQHIYIFLVLYDQLRQREFWNKSNKWISEQTKLGISQTKIYLNELEEWGYLTRTGMGSNRKFSLGSKFDNRTESVPVSKSYRPESVPVLAGISTSNRPESVLHNKNLFNNIIKNISIPIKPLKTTPKPIQEFPPLTDDEVKLIERVDGGEVVTDLERHRAKYLKKRHGHKKAN